MSEKKIQVKVNDKARNIYEDAVSKNLVIETALLFAYNNPAMVMLFKSKRNALNINMPAHGLSSKDPVIASVEKHINEDGDTKW